MMELWDLIGKKLGLKTRREIDCVRNIFMNTVLLNEAKDAEMSQEKLEILCHMTKGFVDEVLKVIDDPVAYQETLKRIKSKLEGVHGI